MREIGINTPAEEVIGGPVPIANRRKLPNEVDSISRELYEGSSALSEARLRVLKDKGPDIHGLIMQELLSSGIVKQDDFVVDLGCGQGQMLMGLNRVFKDAHYLGIDAHQNTFIGSEAILANQRLTNVSFLEHDVGNGLPLANDTVDVLMSNFLLYHVGDWKSVLEEIKRVSKPGGYCEIATRGVDHLKTHWHIIKEACRLAGIEGAETPYGHFDVVELEKQSLAPEFEIVSTIHSSEIFTIQPDEEAMNAYVLSIVGEVYAIANWLERDPPPLASIRDVISSAASDGEIIDTSNQLAVIMKLKN